MGRGSRERALVLVWGAPHSGIFRVRPETTLTPGAVPRQKARCSVVALLALLLILAIFGGLGFAAHVLWILLVVALVLWLIGFFIGGVDGGRRRWYGR